MSEKIMGCEQHTKKWVSRTGHRWQCNTEHAHCMFDAYGFRHTLRVSNIYCFSTATMVTRTCISVTLYAHCLSCYMINQAWASKSPLHIKHVILAKSHTLGSQQLEHIRLKPDSCDAWRRRLESGCFDTYENEWSPTSIPPIHFHITILRHN